jgi:hypothetical protein
MKASFMTQYFVSVSKKQFSHNLGHEPTSRNWPMSRGVLDIATRLD